MRSEMVAQVLLSATLLTGVSHAQGAEPDGAAARLRVAACQILNGPDLEGNTIKVLEWIEKIRDMNLFDDAIDFRDQFVLHFHGFHNDDGGPGGDLITRFDFYVDNQSRHR